MKLVVVFLILLLLTIFTCGVKQQTKICGQIEISTLITSEETLYVYMDNESLYITSQEPNEYDVALGLVMILDTIFVPNIEVNYKGKTYELLVVPKFDEE